MYIKNMQMQELYVNVIVMPRNTFSFTFINIQSINPRTAVFILMKLKIVVIHIQKVQMAGSTV